MNADPPHHGALPRSIEISARSIIFDAMVQIPVGNTGRMRTKTILLPQCLVPKVHNINTVVILSSLTRGAS